MVEAVAAAVVLLALTIVPIAAVALGKRIRSQETFIEKPTTLQDTSQVAISNRWQYVATTLDERGTERIWAYGLWQRGWCRPTVEQDALVILRRGADTLTIPRESIRSVVTSASTVGRGVESDGLVGIVWTNSNVVLTTWLRAISPAEQAALKMNLQVGVS